MSRNRREVYGIGELDRLFDAYMLCLRPSTPHAHSAACFATQLA